MSIELKLSRPNRIYRPSEALEGKIVVKTQSSISHYGIRLTVKGSVNLQVRGGSAGVVESFYGVIKPIPIVRTRNIYATHKSLAHLPMKELLERVKNHGAKTGTAGQNWASAEKASLEHRQLALSGLRAESISKMLIQALKKSDPLSRSSKR